MDEAGRELELALELFEQTGDRVGAVAASSFLCLARPTDRRVPQWLAEALEFADEAGDRSRQLGTLTTLAWHHFIRSLWGTATDTAVAEGFARRLAELGEELGAVDMAVHGRSLLAIMARFSGRLDEAALHAATLQRFSGMVDDESFPWLGWAVTFVVNTARGAADLPPPPAPEGSADPVVGMALLVIEAELTVGGRVDEALARFDMTGRPGLGPFGNLAGLLNGLALVLAGRCAEALPWVERAAEAARLLEAAPSAAGAAALRAEITGEATDLGSAPAAATSIGEALVLRAPRGAGRHRSPRPPAAGRGRSRHAGPAPRAVEIHPGAPRGSASAGGRRLVAEEGLHVAVADRERAPTVRATDVDVLVRRLDVLGFEDHGPPAQPAFRRQGRCCCPETPITMTGTGHEPPLDYTCQCVLNYLNFINDASEQHR